MAASEVNFTRQRRQRSLRQQSERWRLDSASVSKTLPFETQIFWPCERLGWFGFVLVSTTAPRQESRTSMPYDRRNRTHERLTGNWIFREEGFSVCFNAHSVQCIVSQSATTNE